MRGGVGSGGVRKGGWSNAVSADLIIGGRFCNLVLKGGGGGGARASYAPRDRLEEETLAA